MACCRELYSPRRLLVLFVFISVWFHVNQGYSGNPVSDNRADIVAAYEDVRNMDLPDTWLVLSYNGKILEVTKKGSDYNELLSLLQNDKRNYAYLRVPISDDKTRFVLITWIGPSVTPLKKARVSTDKAFVKEILTQFRYELLADDKSDLAYNKIKNKLISLEGSNKAYGRGQ